MIIYYFFLLLKNAHMSVIEALMVLYAKEVASCERISAAINRYIEFLLQSIQTNHFNTFSILM